MGQLYIPAKKKIKGPWFIGQNELEELGLIFDNIDSKLFESLNNETEYEARVCFEKYGKGTYEIVLENTKAHFEYQSKIKNVLLFSYDEKRLSDNTIKGILKDKNIATFKPKELLLRSQYGRNNEFTLKINREFDGELEYNLNCFNPDTQEDIVFEIDKWITKNNPNKGKQIWNQFSFFIGFVSFLAIFLSGIQIITYESVDMHSVYLNEAKQIIKAGVTKDNQSKAIEIVLKYISNYTPEEIKQVKTINKIPLQIFCVSSLLLLISIFHPKTTIGVGRHKNLLKFYKPYTKIILVSIPTIFILTPLIEWIRSLL